MKSTVILDTDGVIFEPIKGKIKDAAIKKYGRIKGLVLVACYNLGVAKQFVADKMADVVYDCAAQAKPMPGALDALKELIEMPGVRVHVCTNVVYPGWRTRLSQEYRAKYEEMQGIKKFKMLSPSETKREYLNYATDQAHASNRRVFVVDSKPENLALVNSRRVNPVLISTDAKDISCAARGACAASFTSLGFFKAYMAQR